jgi:hypothetical protein
VCDGSTQKIYEWIDRAAKDAQIPRRKPIVHLFPQGPHDISLEMVDIVVVTPASASPHPNLNPSLTGRPTVTEASHGTVGEFKYVKGESFSNLVFLDTYVRFLQREMQHSRASNGALHHLIASRTPLQSRKSRMTLTDHDMEDLATALVHP